MPRPGKIVAIGRNYADHATEDGAVPPPSPLMFAKFPSSVVGPGADIRWDPALTGQVDYEAELAVVIGRRARHVDRGRGARSRPRLHVPQRRHRPATSSSATASGSAGKSLDTFCPMGADPGHRRTSCPTPATSGSPAWSTASELQHDRTSSMFFGVRQIISHCSRAFTLEPGDVIATGTPGGVGIFRSPPRLLGDGDVVTVEIEGIGELTNTCRTGPAREA